MCTVSVIVPVYKVEKYLDRCLSSIVNQTYQALEIILVDDGSPDNSGAICDSWALKDNRIKVIHKDNAGLGYARNTGLEAATGEYVLFVDSDDYIMENLCEKAIHAMRNQNADLCYFSFLEDYEFYDGRPQKINLMKNIKSIYSGSEVVEDFLTNMLSQNEYEGGSPAIAMSAWSCFYKRSVIEDNHIRFASERQYLSEDLFFRISLCRHINKVVTISDNLYCYCHNGTSLTTSYRADRLEAATNLFNKLLEDTKVFEQYEVLYKRCQRLYLNNIIACLKQEIVHRRELGFKKNIRNINRICKNETVKETLSLYPMTRLPSSLKLLFGAIKHNWALIVYLIVYTKVRMVKK